LPGYSPAEKIRWTHLTYPKINAMLSLRERLLLYFEMHRRNVYRDEERFVELEPADD
jgi:hypothetical protein